VNIAVIQPFTLSDYPGKLAAIVFCRGCNFQCPYCHNPELLANDSPTPSQPVQIWEFLEARQGKLDAVVISGGEPTLQGDALIPLAQKIKNMGFHIKLDTNGSHPAILSQLLKQELLDYIAMDIKGPPEKYPHITGTDCDWSVIAQSISIIMNSGIDYEFRTTIANPLLTPLDIESCAKLIQGAKHYILQPYNKVDSPLTGTTKLFPPTIQELQTMKQLAAPWVAECSIRN
jgi:pyruvate formate lyase activating enzyme